MVRELGWLCVRLAERQMGDSHGGDTFQSLTRILSWRRATWASHLGLREHSLLQEKCLHFCGVSGRHGRF